VFSAEYSGDDGNSNPTKDRTSDNTTNDVGQMMNANHHATECDNNSNAAPEKR
jgi:hypothetical protein